LDRGPVFGIGAYVDVEFYISCGFGRSAVVQDVLKAYVEGAVGVGGKCIAVLANDVARARVVVSYCVFDLERLC